MPFQPNAIQKPFKKFRKIVKRFPRPATPEDVHTLRTQARHLEAVVHALNLGEKAGGSDLLKDLKPIRKQAGQVRDMDMLVGFASSLDREAEDQCVVQLLEYLAGRRNKAAQKLAKTVAAGEQRISKHLKRCLKLVKEETGFPDSNARDPGQITTKPMILALQLQAELAEWPSFTTRNIHSYRIKVKELRYVLGLDESTESQFGAALGEVKDQIGAWHDWSQLAKIAKKHDTGETSPKLRKQIRIRARKEFGRALNLAKALQARYFSADAAPIAARKAPIREINTTTISKPSRLAS